MFYSDPWFWKFPATSLALSIAAFLAFALPWTFIAWADPQVLQKYRIQGKVLDARKWLLPSLGRIAVNSSLLFCLLAAGWPLLKLVPIHEGALPAWYVIIAQLLLFTFVDDFLYYWMHRAFHTKLLYKYVHSIHHRPVTPVAITGNYFHFLEFAATTGLMLLVPMAIGAHLHVVWIWIVFRQWQAADGHSGYDLPLNPGKIFWGLYKGPRYHDYHHKKFTGNYAGFMSYTDRFFGSYSEGYQRDGK